jgi:hypothetical protein
MADAKRKLDELNAVMMLAHSAASKGDAAGVARVIQEVHIQTGILLLELRKPSLPSAKIYDLSAERRARA